MPIQTTLAAVKSRSQSLALVMARIPTLGTVPPGKLADLVLLDANPLQDIGNVRRIHAVVTARRLFERPALGRLLAQARVAPQE